MKKYIIILFRIFGVLLFGASCVLFTSFFFINEIDKLEKQLRSKEDECNNVERLESIYDSVNLSFDYYDQGGSTKVDYTITNKSDKDIIINELKLSFTEKNNKIIYEEDFNDSISIKSKESYTYKVDLKKIVNHDDIMINDYIVGVN